MIHTYNYVHIISCYNVYLLAPVPLGQPACLLLRQLGLQLPPSLTASSHFSTFATTTKICTGSCFTQACAKSFIANPHALLLMDAISVARLSAIHFRD